MVIPQLLKVEDLVPGWVKRAPEQPHGPRATRILVENTPVRLEVGVSLIEVVVEGSLPDEMYVRLSEAIRANAETFLRKPCVLRE